MGKRKGRSEAPIKSFTGDHAFLSNYWRHPLQRRFEWRGSLWWTSEHAFQAAKAVRKSDAEKIRSTSLPSWAKRIGRQIDIRPDWDDVRDKAMWSVLKAKFAHPEMREMLLATGDAELVEGNDWGDTYWGQVNGKGRNTLGRLLMRLRSKLREEFGDAPAEPGARLAPFRPSVDEKALSRAIRKDIKERMPELRRMVGNVWRWAGHGQYRGAVYVGRIARHREALPCPTGRDWGNPIPLARDADDAERGECVRRHWRLLLASLARELLDGDDRLLRDLARISGSHLVCHCAPKACHGDGLALAAAWAQASLKDMYADDKPLSKWTEELLGA